MAKGDQLSRLYAITTAAFAGLWSRDNDGNFWGRLADSWSVAPDNRVWTTKLRKGVPFHAGVGELTAKDVIWSFNEMAVEGSKGGTGPR